MPSANSPIAIWNSFTPHERSRIAIYIAGIMFYKFGLEMWNGASSRIIADVQARL